MRDGVGAAQAGGGPPETIRRASSGARPAAPPRARAPGIGGFSPTPHAHRRVGRATQASLDNLPDYIAHFHMPGARPARAPGPAVVHSGVFTPRRRLKSACVLLSSCAAARLSGLKAP
jgi:hypothetical protein